MPSALTMRGLIEPIMLEDNVLETVHLLNQNIAQGKEFVATKTADGDDLVIKLGNILTIRSVDDDDGSMPSAF